MPLSVGQGYFTSFISSEKFNAIKESARLPELSLWEKIKAYFFTTHHAEALECIFNLYHHQELNLTPVQVRGAYIKLRALASQGCKEQFIIESQEHADKLIIKMIMVKIFYLLRLNVIRKLLVLPKKSINHIPSPKIFLWVILPDWYFLATACLTP